jgi:cysteine desulfurase/selenocysteine lyase
MNFPLYRITKVVITQHRMSWLQLLIRQKNIHTFFGASSGSNFVFESGTELLFRLISAAVLGASEPGIVLRTTLEHPASVNAFDRWAKMARRDFF